MLCLECATLPRGKASWRQYFKDTADSVAKYDSTNTGLFYTIHCFQNSVARQRCKVVISAHDL